MSKILYRDTEPNTILPSWAEDVDTASENHEKPLLNYEVDQNFANINSMKLDISGKIPTKELRLLNTTQYNNWKDQDQRVGLNETASYSAKLTYDSTNGLTIEADKLTLNVGQIVHSDEWTNFATELPVIAHYVKIGYSIDDQYDAYPTAIITEIDQADKSGILIGDTGIPGEGIINLIFNHDDAVINGDPYIDIQHSMQLFTITDNGNERITFRASDFIITPDDNSNVNSIISLVQTHNQIADLNDLITAPQFTSSYTINTNDSLKEAIEALDAENIPAIKDFIGIDAYGTMPDYNNNDDPYTSVVSDGDSLVTAIANLNSAMNYVIRNVEERTETFIAHSGTMYLVDPYGIDDPYGLVVTLSDTNAGAITIRVESEGEVNVEAQSGNSAIEDNSAGAGNYYPLTETKSYQFIWQSTGTNTGIWRIV